MSTGQTENRRPGNRRIRPRLGRFLLLVCTIMVCAGTLFSTSKPASAELMSLSPFLLLAWAFMLFTVFAVVIVYLVSAVRTRRFRVPVLAPFVAPGLIIALTAMMWNVDLPISVRWHFSAHAFDNAVRQVRAGVDPQTFEEDRLGAYRIRGPAPNGDRGVEQRSYGIYFRTGPMVAYCSGGSGFADLSGHQPVSGAFHHLSGGWYWFCMNSGGQGATVPDHPIGAER